ncbi:hypothetical protein PInf_023769 [Phytophthora infestans]|nr:hypothetical protein PInf_023769 [Phytophthora infestans]
MDRIVCPVNDEPSSTPGHAKSGAVTAPRRKSARTTAPTIDDSDLEEKAPTPVSTLMTEARLPPAATATQKELSAVEQVAVSAPRKAAVDPTAAASPYSTAEDSQAGRSSPLPTTVLARPNAAPSSRSGFNLEEFMSAYGSSGSSAAVARAAAAPAVALSEGESAAMAAPREENARLLRMLDAQGTSQCVLPASSVRTAPNARGELPPRPVCYRSCTSFPERPKKAKGEYNPPQAHLLAGGRMFKNLLSQEGKPLSAMSFVLWIREAECIKFLVNPAVLMALFSGRLGSRGLTLLHFREVSEMESLVIGSNNGNFGSDFSPSAQLPPATTTCASYDDILDGIHGLASFGNEFRYDHVRKITSRLRVFVSKNKSADPGNTPQRVVMTLRYANKFLGNAIGHLQSDSPQWWHGYCEALRAIDYHSSEWTLALVSTLTQTEPQLPQRRADADRRNSRDQARGPAVSEDIRRMLSVNRRGQEPCLRNLAGLPCSGGTRDRCGNPRRAHNWQDGIPAPVQEWVNETYGARSINHRR